MFKNSIYFIFVSSLLALVSCKPNAEKAASDSAANTIYYNGDIITMVGEKPQYVEAIAVKDGLIQKVGKKDAVLELQGDSTKVIDLKGKTMFPGFIDAHAHFFGFGPQASGANLLPPPDGKVKNIEGLINELKTWATPENIELTGWIYGLGFDDSQLEEQRFPTKEDLDKVSTTHPILILHISGHFCVMNSKGLEMVGITADMPDPEGGVVRRMPNSREPNGVLEEMAAIPYMAQAITPKTPEKMAMQAKAGLEMAKSYGYTTAQEGKAMEQHELLAAFAEKGLFDIDIVSYVDHTKSDYLNSKWYSKSYNNHYRIGGIKMTLDGSPQGRTAWRTTPYLLPPDGASKDYKGYPAIPDDNDVADVYKMAYKNDWQILSHANGDAAVDQMIKGLQMAEKEYGSKDLRNVLIHGQYVRKDQLDSLKPLNVIASLFPLHTFYWGDWHTQLIGEDLVQGISPTRTALDKGLKITIHTDAPVALPNLMRMVWTAVSRTSRSGKTIGADERLTPYEAMKCLTEWSAYQHWEDDKKGTLEEGKLADLVVLTDNPLKVEVDAIKDIEVLKTIKEGKLIFERE
ncbi:amidohydrolase [Winogradskyella sp. J14-2]|uniref:amidohydrolase n=1 Tax=Winogradskyella sp. J14-2 TaxID=1936080 RepID=UPI000972E4E6|nr:amidohydrolase [Winogradskyella sp. J14-2]APY07817.1 amidohydrolase [Winogradskyella sp. J14-2]